jgi:hypothetical protein
MAVVAYDVVCCLSMLVCVLSVVVIGRRRFCFVAVLTIVGRLIVIVGLLFMHHVGKRFDDPRNPVTYITHIDSFFRSLAVARLIVVLRGGHHLRVMSKRRFFDCARRAPGHYAKHCQAHHDTHQVEYEKRGSIGHTEAHLQTNSKFPLLWL